ncbi:MAG: glutamine-hydrolyzing GMP synthase [Candidatus Poribacteria bacterium]|nr:glutamine-hydrolyzing GMP synthase [Candidatus Poribacteria bacterium]
MKRETIVVLDFGSQYTQLIARRIRERKVYCEIHPYHISIEQLATIQPKGIVLSGGPSSVYASDAPLADAKILTLGVPILGICYGMQFIAHLSAGGKVHPALEREYGSADVMVDLPTPLFADVPERMDVWMSHGDRINLLPDGFQAIAHTRNSPIAAMANLDRDIYGLQFHPEVVHTKDDNRILSNFVHQICGCSDQWTMQSFIAEATEAIRATTQGRRVLCAVSGGVDSTVLAVLLQHAVGDALTCIFVNNGLLRKAEAEEVLTGFGSVEIDVHYVDATDRFLKCLAGVEKPEEKRKRIGDRFIRVFQDELQKLGEIDFLAQGTLYPDVIESVSTKGPSATIKTHHNVGGLPENLTFKLIEPFRELFKDEVREVGRELGMPEWIIKRHPFPGPGLAVRVLGEITQERLDILREADEIFITELRKAGLYDEIWQALTVLLPVKSVGVMGDERTYENVAALRAVTSTDGMTADWAKIPHDVLGVISNRIINEVRGINRVVYDISSKPPSTIEWE